MNTDPYERHLDRSLDAPEPARELAESELSALARHADPSVRPASSAATHRTQPLVRRMGPSE